jgi:hypothetical protein
LPKRRLRFPGPPAFYLILYLSYLIVDLGCCGVIGTGTGGLEKDGDVVGLTGSFVQRSAERTTADFGA